MTPEHLGFSPLSATSWSAVSNGTMVIYRALSGLEELVPVEAIQRDVFGATDLDIYAAGQLMSFAEAGGHTLTAWIDGQLAGALIGIGGMIDGRPKILSDWMGLYPRYRSFGIGGNLKRLQAAVSLAAGYSEITWTVDPLRAANARLNFGKLGAWSDHYEENRYGEAYGEALYGGLPSDRFHVRWSITDPDVQSRIVSPPPLVTPDEVAQVPDFEAGWQAERVLIRIPNDIDRVLKADPAEALAWRMAVRRTLPVALESGYRATGFVGNIDPERDISALILTREPA